ncbi:DNA-binding transcriptional regulator, LysR family [Psychrobacillus sp. OK028]|uniref:LysR family transcriptional regulator n=1 Tax=Psychrobacillus sp. OK028 TaxID=1884359 RepID=UPI00088B1706|nr:LysR family transcriptional regulator [Psychrobacillus sp. OK028]SDN59944.1 DNA-binding transcriptional regulator, LysR family [Psychrobacillus sp. OK028]
MDEKDWISLIVISEEKNLSNAAKKLYLSQPALTYRMNNIEERFGVKIFYKIRGGIEFTTEGIYLIKYAEEMMARLKQVQDEVLNVNGELRGVLNIGASSNFAQYKLPRILKRFSEYYPSIQFKVHTGWSKHIMDLLNSSSVHVGIMRGNYAWHGTKTLLHKERLCLISKQEVDFEEIPTLPFIQYKTDSSLKELIEVWWHDHFQNPPNVTMETDRQETCKEMVKNDLGISILPEICLRKSDELYRYELNYRDKEPVIRDTWVLHKEEVMNLKIVKVFIEFLQTYEEEESRL